MGMNRKWNMKVFELHDSDSSHGGQGDIPTPTPNDDVYVDTDTTEIIMSKYPFTKEGMLPEGADTDSILEINLSDLTSDADFLAYIKDKSNWHFRQGGSSNLNIVEDGEDTQIKFNSVVKAFIDLPTDSSKWVLKFDLHTNPSSYRSFLYFDGISDETQTSIRYQYGIDIPSTGLPHLESVNPETMTGSVIETTVADEQYFTGTKDMPVVVTRWNNTYTLYYDNRYMITIPSDEETLNRIGFWTWSGSNMYIKNPELFIIDNDSDATNIIINTNTTADDPDSGESDSNTQYNYTIKKVWVDNDNESELRPDDITLSLYHKGGVFTGCHVTAANDWQREVSLPQVTSVREAEIENYAMTSVDIADNLITVTNTLNTDNA